MIKEYIKNDDGSISQVTTVPVDIEQVKAGIAMQLAYELNQRRESMARTNALKEQLAQLGELEEE